MVAPASIPSRTSVTGPLRLRGVSAGYGSAPVLEGVDLDLPSGSITGVVGPNGSGKTTLLRAIVGLTPQTSGAVSLGDAPIGEVRRRIAYVPQREVVDWGFPVTVGEVAMMGRYPAVGWWRRPRGDDRRIVSAALDRVGMAQHADIQIGALSGGQQQRVFLARALAQDASVLLLDEPMTGIDRATEETIGDLLAEIRAYGAIVVLTTHDLESAAETCDLLTFVNHRIVAFGPPDETFTASNLHATFGGELLIVHDGDHRHVHGGGHHHPGGQG